MWIVTKSEWPALVNLSLVRQITYQQLTKSDPHVRVIASTLEQEFVLVDCDSGEEARAVVRLIAQELSHDRAVLDLSRVEVAGLTAGEEPGAGDEWL